ncbi:MAG TPA: glycosyltransferase [Candidatus Binatia bacterium]|nr:glycosyltransferase [Candidatus Binatia bacterium]
MPYSARITALIPTYNCERYICETVESVLAQTLPAHEVIVVDDGSTDDTQQALARYGTRIRYVRQANAGPPAARNNGIALATGDLIALLDSDDLWLPNKLERQMRYLDQHPRCGLVYSDMKTFDETGVIEESVKVSRNLTLPSGHIFPQMFAETLFQTSAVLLRKTCIDHVGGFDTSLRMGDDYEFFLRISRHYELGYIDEPLVLYRQHPQQGTRTWGKELQQGAPWEFLVLKRIVDLYPEIYGELGKAKVNHRLAKPYAALAYACLNEGDPKDVRALLRRALRYWPGNLSYWRYYLLSFLDHSAVTKIQGRQRKRKSLAFDRCESTPPERHQASAK